ncbi:MAG: M48 family metallopeptidase [Eubacterium sp.]|nr:M48 family metallopeptidase [Eubacterium sp.]
MKYEIIRSKRKSIGIQVVSSEKVIVRAPMKASIKSIEEVINANILWIEKQKNRLKKTEEVKKNIEPLSQKELKELAEKACIVFRERAEYFAPLVGVTYGRITVRNQKSRWGSCSSKGNLNFNVALMLAPPEVLDYVVVHELSHRIYMNHSKDFWAKVESVCPSYKEHEKWLKTEGAKLIYQVRPGGTF